MSKEKLFKFVVNDIEYGCLLQQNLNAIEQTIGAFDVVKVRQHPLLSTKMTIWCKKKGE